MPACDPTTSYARTKVWGLLRANEMFGAAYPCDGDTQTWDTPDEAQDDQPEVTE